MAVKVLVVDDQILPRQLFESIINNAEDFELIASINSATLADLYCARGNVDLIIMDVVMADGYSGLDAAFKIKKSYPSIKIIIVTSMPDALFLARAREIGVDSFWYKEVQDAPMIDVMNRTMAGENIYPDEVPEVWVGLVKNSELTEREMDVLRMLVNGYTDGEIADKLGVSYHTVRFHLNSLLTKSGCSSRTDLAIQAVKSGMVVPTN